MTASELKQKYLAFFKKQDHQEIPTASLIPINDPTVLFTTAGMHPLVPFLLGETHPAGKRLVNVQKCLRTDDIDEVGDSSHNTFFEMLGNWSLGDYFKEESIQMSFEFLTKQLSISVEKLFVTVFAGDESAPFDEESKKAWRKAGISEERIFALPKKDNWWGPVGKSGPCGPDTEIFVDTGKEPCSESCRPGDGCEKYVEIWNNVFMEYRQTTDGTFEKLKQPNVDTGMGVERTTAVLQEVFDVYRTELFSNLISRIEKLSGQKYGGSYLKPMRIMADHVRASVFILADGVLPSNTQHGYILRRLIRRTLRQLRHLDIREAVLWELAQIVIADYQDQYPELLEGQEIIKRELEKEEAKFLKTLETGLKEFKKLSATDGESSLGELAFDYFQTYGFPPEMFLEEIGKDVDLENFWKSYNVRLTSHQDQSRVATKGVFKSGLADNSYQVTKYHTTTHLLQAALRKVLGDHVNQRGSNLTAERLRFDFSHDAKLSPAQIDQIEAFVNQAITDALPVTFEIVDHAGAEKLGATMLFNEKYGDQVKVYKIGNISVEACAGPHVASTSELGHLKIIKEEAVSAGVRRIKAVLE